MLFVTALLQTHDRLVLEAWQVQRTLDGSRDKQSVLSRLAFIPCLKAPLRCATKRIKSGQVGRVAGWRSSLAWSVFRCDVQQIICQWMSVG
jgi:hypothetical protein